MSNVMKFSDFKTDDYDSISSKVTRTTGGNTAMTAADDSYNVSNGFSTIDLNNTHLQNETSSPVALASSSISSGYTSFDQPFAPPAAAAAAAATTVKSISSSSSPVKQQQQPIDFAQTGTKLAVKTANTIENLKQWSKSAFKCTKQIISEKLGKTSRTVDPELEAEIEKLRETRRRYESLLVLSRSMVQHFSSFIQTQKSMSDVFSDLAQKTPELLEEFSKNSEAQRVVFKNGEALLSALEFFTSNLQTLCFKTIEDTMITIRNYEAARLEYDAYRCDLELQKHSSINSTTVSKTTNSQQQISQTQRSIESKQNQLNETERQYKLYKEKYERFRDDVTIKIKFLDENRLKVMQKQLLLFHNATSAYFTGNQEGLEATMRQFSVKLITHPSTTSTLVDHELKESFLEKN